MISVEKVPEMVLGDDVARAPLPAGL